MQETKALSDKLEATETGGLDLSLLGTFWIALGIVMTTAPGELAQSIRDMQAFVDALSP